MRSTFFLSCFNIIGGGPRRPCWMSAAGQATTRGPFRAGIWAIGLDCCDEMVRFARDEAATDGAAVDWRIGDMCAFTLPEPVDLAVCLFNSIDSLCSIDDFVEHFRAVSANLVHDGLYVIGQSHQRDVSIIGYGPFHYAGSAMVAGSGWTGRRTPRSTRSARPPRWSSSCTCTKTARTACCATARPSPARRRCS